MTDPYAPESETNALTQPDTRTPAERELARLLTEAADALQAYVDQLVESHTVPGTGTLDDADVVLKVESEQDLVNRLREATLVVADAVQEPVAICPNCLGTKRPHADDPDWRGCCDCTPPAAQPAPVQDLPLAVVSRLGFKLALDEGLRQRADKIASALRGGRVNYEVEQDAANLIWEMRDAVVASTSPAQPSAPEGWRLEKNADGTIIISCPIGGVVVEANPNTDRRIPESILHALADAMLTAVKQAPAQEPVAYLFTNVQSGDSVADTDPSAYNDEREMWFREPLGRIGKPATAQPTTTDRSGCSAGTDDECTNKACARACPALATPPAAPVQEFVCSTGLCHYKAAQPAKQGGEA